MQVATDEWISQHQARLRRVLVLVQHCHGTFTTTIARRLTGWEERSIQRYARELQEAGLIERPDGRGFPRLWSLTQAGRDHLRNTATG